MTTLEFICILIINLIKSHSSLIKSKNSNLVDNKKEKKNYLVYKAELNYTRKINSRLVDPT